MEALISVSGVTKYAAGLDKNRYVLKDIDFQIKRGDFVAITGPAGNEKTALLRLLCLRDKPDKGSVFFTGIDTGTLHHSMRKNLLRHVFGTVFQKDTLYSHISVLKNVALPLLIQVKNPKEACNKRVTDILEAGLANTGGIRKMTSVSQDQSSIILLEFEFGTNIDMVKAALPDNANAPMMVQVKANDKYNDSK